MRFDRFDPMSGPRGPRGPVADGGDMRPAGKGGLKKALGRSWIILVVVLLIICLMNSFYSINEQENAVVVTFGVPAPVTTSGLHFKIPFVQQVQKVDMTIRGVAIGYDINNGSMVAVETEIGSKIYHGVFDIPADKFQFRFYTQLGDWDSWSIGAQDDDNPVDIAFTDGKYTGPVFISTGGGDKKGKGSWKVADWTGGKVEVIVNLNTESIEMTMFEGNKVYIVGACNGWNINSDAMALKETADGSNIFTGTVNVNAGEFTFRFYTQLGDWETNSIGASEPDEDVAISMASGNYTGACVDGKGKWADASWAGGNVTITLDLNTYTVNFEKAE